MRGNVVSFEDDLPLASYIQSCKQAMRKRARQQNMRNEHECQKPSSLEAKRDTHEISNNSLLAKATVGEKSVGCKRSRKVISNNDKSDDTEEGHIKYYMEQTIVPVRLGETIFMVDARGSIESDLKTIGWLMAEVVQLFCLQLYNNNKSSGMKPIVQHIVYGGNILESNQLVKDLLAALDPGDTIDAVIDGWARITLAERYVLFCHGLDQTPNPKLLSKLYSLKFLEDKVVASDCELEDVSVLPLLKALGEDGIFSHLDLSHNSLGCQTVSNIQEIIASSKIKDLGLTLDLHANRLGGSALLQICKCPVTLSRLEVLNLSGNRLTDASGRILTRIIEKCKALAILNLQGCALTSRTIESISNALHLESGLVKLSIGKNNPISGNAMANLLKKLSVLKSFSELDITDVVLNNVSIESLCHLLNSSSNISTLAIGGTKIGMNGALKLSRIFATVTSALTVLDMSFCSVDPRGGSKLCEDLILHGLVQLNLSGNRLEEQGANVLGHLLAKACCHLKILMINRCHLGNIGILKIIQALSGNSFLQDLGLAGNNITENTGAQRYSMESCVQGVEKTLNCHAECSDSKASDWSRQHENPTYAESTSLLDCVSSKHYNNLANDQKCQSLPTCFESSRSEARACVGEKSENTMEKRLPHSCHQHETSCDEDMAGGEDEDSPNSVNCSSLKADCASSSQPFGLIRDRSHLLLDLHTNENVLIKEGASTIKLLYGEYASDLFAAIQMAKSLHLLDLSDNSMPSEMVEQLYLAWSLNTKAGTPAKHIDSPLVHFTHVGKQCCGVRPCCE